MVYRIVLTDPPTRRDFLSAAALGKHLRDPSLRHLHEGVSVFATEEEARSQAARFPRLGRYVAEVRLPPEARIERTGRAIGHHTVWGDPDALLAAVVRVVPVR